MLHPDLTISGKHVADEQELKVYFQQEELECVIGDCVLYMIRQSPDPIPVSLTLDTPRHGYAIDNYPEERDLLTALFEEPKPRRCSEEDFWQMVLYFCQTGKRPISGYWEQALY